MKCFIRANNVEIAEDVREKILQRVETAFANFRDKVKFVVITFQSIADLRGGKDQRCKIKVVSEDVNEIYTMDVHDTSQAAFHLALTRARRTFTVRAKKLMRSIKRRQAKKSTPMLKLAAPQQLASD